MRTEGEGRSARDGATPLAATLILAASYILSASVQPAIASPRELSPAEQAANIYLALLETKVTAQIIRMYPANYGVQLKDLQPPATIKVVGLNASRVAHTKPQGLNLGYASCEEWGKLSHWAGENSVVKVHLKCWDFTHREHHVDIEVAAAPNGLTVVWATVTLGGWLPPAVPMSAPRSTLIVAPPPPPR
ncbi:MAG: hypothetical protein JWM65_1961 [Sphingomonas bacterium]|nr:hypothetical protein [Sphingomonas bacterium]